MKTEIDPQTPQKREVNTTAILFAVLVIAVCGLVYELIASTLASYVLGDSVTQFSTVIGVYLSAMGLGSWLSSAIRRMFLVDLSKSRYSSHLSVDVLRRFCS